MHDDQVLAAAQRLELTRGRSAGSGRQQIGAVITDRGQDMYGDVDNEVRVFDRTSERDRGLVAGESGASGQAIRAALADIRANSAT
ncbi:hypothetical protein [Nonomuraea sp. NPDC003709]|uniref:hypothetical protein n=1 Tax=Nonomuraea sp. NPDC003709 TaxID=3154450 RepID=UPI0033AB77A9